MTDVLYIGGASRSGTTFIERLLGRLPETQTLGEVRHLWSRGVLDNQLCGCGQPFHECGFWQSTGELAYGGWDPEVARRMEFLKESEDRSRRIPALVADHLRGRVSPGVVEYAHNYGRLYAAAASSSASRVMIDSSKHVAQPFAMLADPTIDMKILQVVRDPRGVAYSWSKQVVRPEIIGETRMMDRLSSSQVAIDWDVQNGLFALAGRVRIPRLLIRYEDFLAAPAVVMARVADFVGVSMPDSLRTELDRRMVSLDRDHSVAGNPVRFRTGDVQLRADEAWRHDLPRRDRFVVTVLTSPLMTRYRRKIPQRTEIDGR